MSHANPVSGIAFSGSIFSITRALLYLAFLAAVGTLALPTGASAAIVVNEVLGDPPPAPDGDANGDGVRDALADEFVEIVNTGDSAVDLSGWVLSDAFTERHVFPAGTLLPADCSIVVFGGPTPTGNFGGSLAQVASSGLLGLNNAGDSVSLADPSGVVIDSMSYDGAVIRDQSATRSPDGTGAFVAHSTVPPGNLFSPGRRADGSNFVCGPPVVQVTLIHDIQGSGSASPLAGQNVVIEGVVVGDYPGLGGFFVQEEDVDNDGDPLTSEGIWVSRANASVSAGDRVRVTGTVAEADGLTQLDNVSLVVTLETGSSAAVTSVPLGLPLTGIDDLEAFEGMRVNFAQTLTVTDTFDLGRFGTVSLATDRLYIPTQVAEPGAAALAVEAQNNLSRIELDDGSGVQNPDPVIYPAGGLSASNTLRSGDTVTGLSAVLDQRFGSYRLQPVGVPNFLASNPRPAFPVYPGGSLTVASVNLQNYFVTLDRGVRDCGPARDQGCRGADSAAELARQTAKLVALLNTLDADIVGLASLENTSGVPVLATLVAELNSAAGAGTWDFIDTGTVGEDAIKTGLVYRPARVTPAGRFALLDSPGIFPDFNQMPLAQTFSENASGEKLTVVVNHFKSKGASCNAIGDPDTGDGQGNCNLTRVAVAESLVSWLKTDPTGSGDPDFLITGNLNAYAMEDPIDTLRDGGYTDLAQAFIGPFAYGFAFSGEFGYLHYALSSESLTPQITGVSEWHVNADEPRALDYNEEFKSPGQQTSFFAADPFRASDHDPLIVGLDLRSAAPIRGDVDEDGDVDRDDLTLLLEARNQPASGPDDPRDLDGDGTITVLDARQLVLLCTRPSCATN